MCRSVYPQKDLEEIAQDFVMETRKITVPGYPHAFNASITQWKGRWLMSFRIVQESSGDFSSGAASSFVASCSATSDLVLNLSATSDLGLIWLDESFTPIGPPQFILPDQNIFTEDARLIVDDDQKLYVIYSASCGVNFKNGDFRVYVAELNYEGNNFYVVHNECLANFDGSNPNRREKNWVPFIFGNELLMAYHLFPHKIFRPLLNGTGECELVSKTFPSFIWEWGELRGGTPAIKINEEYYLGIFHSSLPLTTLHSKSRRMLHYFMGAYLFSTTPPFEIKYVSPEPIIGPKFYNGEMYRPYWNPVCVVFPCGLIVDEEEIYIMYGRQDHEIWITKLNKMKLFESLIHVSSFPYFTD